MSNILGNMPPVFGSGNRGVVPAPSAADVSAQNILRADGTWGATPGGAIPSQTGNAGKLLTTDGTNASWASSLNTFAFGDVTFGTSGPSAKSSINARAARQGLVFDGTAGATVSVPAFGTGDFTVAAWVNPTLSAGSNLISGNAAINVPQIAVTTNGTIAVANQGIGTIVSSSAGALVANKTKLVVWRRASGTSYLYIDGIEIGSAADTSNFSTGVGNIGSRGFYGGEIFIGTLSVLIYNRALSAAEVVSLFEAGVPAAADYYNTGAGAASVANVSSGDVSTVFTGVSASGFTATRTGGSGRAYVNLAGKFGYLRRNTKISIKATLTVTGTWYISQDAFATTTQLTSGSFNLTMTGVAANDYVFIYTDDANATLVWASNDSQALGLLLAPDAGQAGGGLTWYDTSGNAANITLPASGVAWAVPSSQKTASGWTFGGNLTVSSSSAYLKLASTGSSNTWDLFSDSNGSFYLSQSGVVNALRVFPTTGNFSVGAGSTDSGQKLQVNGTAYVSGDATFAGDVTVNKSTPLYALSVSGSRKGYLYFSGSDIVLGSDTGNLVLSSASGDVAISNNQALKLGNLFQSGAPTATGYVTIKDSAGNTYKLLAGT